jgi:cytochrome oxidase Cu insertion factor (SCO1/SenC/PrrC family)
MSKIIKPLVLVMLLAVAALASEPKVSEPKVSEPKVGDAAPPLSLTSANGSTVSLKDYAGKSKLVLIFYRGYW